MSDPPLSDIDFKNKMAVVWTTLKFFNRLGVKFLMECLNIYTVFLMEENYLVYAFQVRVSEVERLVKRARPLQMNERKSRHLTPSHLLSRL